MTMDENSKPGGTPPDGSNEEGGRHTPEAPEQTRLSPAAAEIDEGTDHWTAKFARPILFVIITIIGMGIYLVATNAIPVAVFPTTNFPKIIVGVDNGVAPIDQMQV